jgi:peptidoglycan/xylan/chitin deacetylase (PgdA/CDA1 family)
MFATLFRLLAPMGERSRLPILIFHRVHLQRDPLFPGEVTADEFSAICGWLREWFQPLPLEEAVQRLAQGRLPAAPVAITFDDGYADNHDVALPILRRHGLSATFFIATGFLDGGRMWNDTIIEAVRRTRKPLLEFSGTAAESIGSLPTATDAERHRAAVALIRACKHLPGPERAQWVDAVAERAEASLPDDLMMTRDQVRALHRAGMGIGGHTVNHPILARQDRAGARAEIEQGRQELASITQSPINLFAYPNGQPGVDYGPEAVEIVRELGFTAAVSTAWGAARKKNDALQLPRFTPWDRSRTRFGLRLAHRMLSAS